MALESVKLDLMGEQHVDFDAVGLTLVAQGYSALRLPGTCNGKTVAWNQRLLYSDIEWVGVLRRRQWEMLVPAVLFLPLGIIWSAISVGDWGPLGFSLVVLLLLGVVPLVIFLRGRAYVGIATQTQILVWPLDRNRKALRRILGLLRQQLPTTVPWRMEGSPFADMATLDNRPPTGKAFNQKRYAVISLLIGLYGLANLLVTTMGKGIGGGISAAILVVALVWLAWSVWNKSNWR